MNNTVNDIIHIMERIAPTRLAEEWDHVGLQLGQRDWPVRNIWVALDPSVDVVAKACRSDVDLLITHHPLIFEPLNAIDFETPVGAMVKMAAQHQLALFVAHTNLDSSAGGINDYLADRLALRDLKVLKKPDKSNKYKLVFYVPLEHEKPVLNALFETRAGEIGPYTCCSFRGYGKGSFRPGSSANPYSGKIDEISFAEETRIETVVRKNDIDDVLRVLKAVHPYETMAYDIYPLMDFETTEGLGRIGTIEKQTDLLSFARRVKNKLGLSTIKIAGKPDLIVKTAAVCSGSGAGLMNDFIASGADVYISGDLKFHDARTVEAAGLGLVDIGHFASERVMIDMVADRLKKIFRDRDMVIDIRACDFENDPFVRL
jgi:dinuclear metal center YbgI/SA1388 family protein